jgi:hypothetical protein
MGKWLILRRNCLFLVNNRIFFGTLYLCHSREGGNLGSTSYELWKIGLQV